MATNISRTGLAATILALAIAIPAGAHAGELQVSFRESAPKDRFTIRNSGTCTVASGRISIDLAGSAGKLIFDTTATGSGVEVFQPFEIVTGRDKLARLPTVRDGDQRIDLDVRDFAAGDEIAFTIDVDDTLRNSELGQIRVSGSEISGGRVIFTSGGASSDGQFSAAATARVAASACVS
ncbi:MAG: aggregation factor core [Pseudomonadota bacterium]